MHVPWWLVGVLALGCTPAAGPGRDPAVGTSSGPDTDDGTTDPPVDSPTVDTSVTDTGPTTTGTPVDCANLPAAPLAWAELGPHRGYHGLAIDGDGYLRGSDESNLVKVDVYGDFAVHTPGTGGLEQMDWLPDGDLAVADYDTESVWRIDASGAMTLIAGSLGYLYGLRVGPDGMIYTANQTRIHRVDPATGATEVWFDAGGAFRPKVFDWSPDYTRFYVGTTSGAGEIYVFDLDVATLDPIAPPMPFATGTGGWHDCLSVDECGNLWVCDFTDLALWRISPDGQLTSIVQWDEEARTYGHGLTWGSGSHGWSDTSIVLPQPKDGNTVVHLEIGVRSRSAVAPPWP